MFQDNTNLQFQSGLKIFGNHVWTVSNRLQNYIIGEVADGEINIRINVGRISDLVRNTKCDNRQDPFDIQNLVFPTSQPTHHSHACSTCPP